MSESKVRGIVHLIEETKTYGQKGFRKRLVVLEQDNGRFANFSAEAISFKVLTAGTPAEAEAGDSAAAANDAFADSYDENDIPF